MTVFSSWCLLLLVVFSPFQQGQGTPGSSAADSVAVGNPNSQPVTFHPLFYPMSIYSPVFGFGIAGGVRANNFPSRYTKSELTANPSQRRGLYTLAVSNAGNPYARIRGQFRTWYELTGARGFYGLGAASRKSNPIRVKKETVGVELQYESIETASPYSVHPFLRLEWHRVHGFRSRRAGAFDRLDDLSQSNLINAAGPPDADEPGPQLTGVTAGVRLEYDTRNSTAHTTHGTAGVGSVHIFSAPATDLWFISADGGYHRYIWTGGESAVAFRVFSTITRSLTGKMIPFYLLPVLDRDSFGAFERYRLTGNDLLFFGLKYQLMLVNIFNHFGITAYVMAGAGNAYNDIFTELSPGISFRRHFDPESARYPLRPALIAGGNFISMYSDTVILNGSAGLSAEGIAFGTLSFILNVPERRVPSW